MNDEIIIDDAMFPAEPTAPRDSTAVPGVPAVNHPGPGGNWSMILCLIAMAFMFGSRMDGCRLPVPDDDSIVIDEKGKFALILEDKTEAGQAKLTVGQKTALNSTMTADAAEEAGFELRIQDVNDDLSKMEQVWQTLRQNAQPAPSLTVSSEGRLRTGTLPDGVDKIKTALESIK